MTLLHLYLMVHSLDMHLEIIITRTILIHWEEVQVMFSIVVWPQALPMELILMARRQMPSKSDGLILIMIMILQEIFLPMLPWQTRLAQTLDRKSVVTGK